MAEKPSLSDRALARLRSYAKDNGLSPDSFEVIKAKEEIYNVEGTIRLTPLLSVQTSASFGRVKEKNRKLFSTFNEMKQEIARLKEEFERGGQWLDEAIKEMEKDQSRGWGHSEAAITWSDQETLLAATENCPTCRGTGHSSCMECQGLGTVPCLYCEARGQEFCPHCQGRGEDPAQPGKQCPICHGKRFTNCRFCQATGKMQCERCQGKGGIPCAACHGTGFLTQEARITETARVDFSLGPTSGLPSGLLRMMDRIGETNLSKGYADIVINPPAPEGGLSEARSTIKLTAQIPYADIKMRIGKQEYVISAFGKTGRLSSVPSFLDQSTSSARAALAQAAKGLGPLDKALTVRLIRDALGLTLGGKTQTNDLRRLYPTGLSGNAAEEIMRNISLALKYFTMKARGLAGGLALLVSALLFGGYFFSPLFARLHANEDMKLIRTIEVLVPLLVMGAAWMAILHTAKWALKRKYPTAGIAQSQNVGKIGYVTVCAIAVIYVLFFYLANNGYIG